MQNIVEPHQQEHVMKFLMGLNDTSEHVRAQIILQYPLPPLNKVFSLITREERQWEIRSIPLTIVENTTLLSRTRFTLGSNIVTRTQLFLIEKTNLFACIVA